MKTQKFIQIDMTQGNIFRSILSFSIPLLAGSLLQTLYNTVDSMIIGNYGSTDALAGVSASQSPMMILLAVMLGLSSGVSVLVSQVFGSKEEGKIKEAIGTANGFFTYSVIPITICAVLLINPMLSLINIQGAAKSNAQLYLLIVFGGLIANFGYNLNAGILRGLGDSRSPLLFLFISFLANIILDLVFVMALHWGVSGVAFATMISTMAAWIYSIWHIKHHFPELKYRVFSLHINRTILLKMLSLSLPMMLNHGIFSVGFLLYYRFVNGFGSAFMAGYGIAGKLENLIWLPVSSLGTAAVTFSGQNSGAGNLDLLNKGVKLFLKMAVSINMLASIASLLWGRWIFGLFSSDPAVIDAAYNYISILTPFYWLYAIIHILSSLMNGVGDTKVPAVITLVMFWGVRIPVAWYMSLHFPGRLLHIAYPISWVAACIMAVGYFMTGRWKGHVAEKTVQECSNSC